MISTVVYAIVALSVTGAVAAIILYFVARRFRVYEDPRIDVVTDKLPGANCGGCGFAGCRALAEAIVKSESMDGKFCPVGGNKVMHKVAEVMGLKAGDNEPMIAVVRCNGGECNSPRKADYDGLADCASANMNFAGKGGCAYGCLGFGNCVKACKFDAIKLNEHTALPEVDEEKCVACGACAKACPRNIIELRFKGKNDRRVFVICVNKEKGADAKKNCTVACIGCGKCAKVCPFDAIKIENNLSYIDFNKCRLCRKCVDECPTGAIHAVNFPIKRVAASDKESANQSEESLITKS